MAIRLVFQNDEGKIRLVRHQRVDMLVPQTLSFEHGMTAELRDASDETVHRQSIPEMPGVEVFSPETMQRVDAPGVPRTFMIVVPDVAAARAVVLVESRPQSRARLAADAVESPREIARFLLDEETP